jgi:arylsulfatase A-like enzyme
LNVVFITIDSLSRHFLQAYGQEVEIEVATPNLDRFAARAAAFQRHYSGSLPCMPARRELFTGTQEFLWRPWGPIEPFDRVLAREARQNGSVTQLITDHFHYFQHGSSGYYEDYNGFEFIRGHEYDAWQTAPPNPDPTMLQQILADKPDDTGFMNRAAYARNVSGFTRKEDFFAPKVFTSAADWIDRNRDYQNWLLVVDSFEVHEPFHCPEPYASMYTDEDPLDPTLVTWPLYGRSDEGRSALTERQLAFVRAQYAGKVTMVDKCLGKVFDQLDANDLWDDTIVIVTTDHGHYLGEHNWLGKPGGPVYNTLAHIPLLIWSPGSPLMGQRPEALTSAVDLYATMLDALGVPSGDTRHSRSLMPLLQGTTTSHREWALYGYWGSSVNVTDGRYTYMHPCDADQPTYCYSSSMINPYRWFWPAELQRDAEAGSFLPYADGPVWRYAAPSHSRHGKPLLHDVLDDPRQQDNLAGHDTAAQARMRDLLSEAMVTLQAPQEQFARLGLA